MPLYSRATVLITCDGELIINGSIQPILADSSHSIAEAISMSDRILVFSSRPAKLRAVHRIELTVGNTPLSRRNSPEFKDYFDMIWKEIDHDEQ